MNSMKRQKDSTLKDELPRWVGAQYATGEAGRNNSRKNEEIESKQKKNAQLRMWLVTEVKSNAAKNNPAKKPGMLGPWIKQIGSGQTGDGKSEHWYFRNQQIKMDWNGWI